VILQPFKKMFIFNLLQHFFWRSMYIAASKECFFNRKTNHIKICRLGIPSVMLCEIFIQIG